MSKFEVWAAGRGLEGVDHEALLANLRALFPKATPSQLARFTAGERFLVTRVPDEDAARRVVAALTKAGVPSDIRSDQSPHNQPPPVQASASMPPQTSPAVSHADQPAEPNTLSSQEGSKRINPAEPLRRAARSKASTRQGNFITTLVTWLFALAAIAAIVRGEMVTSMLLSPALVIAVPAIARRISGKAHVAILAVLAISIGGKVAVFSYLDWKRHSDFVSDYQLQRVSVLERANADLAGGQFMSVLKLTHRWAEADDPELLNLENVASTQVVEAIDRGEMSVLNGASESDFPLYRQFWERAVRRGQSLSPGSMESRDVSTARKVEGAWPMSDIVTVVSIIFAALLALYLQSRNKKAAAEIKAKIDSIPNFAAGYEYVGADDQSGIAIDVGDSLVCLLKRTSNGVRYRTVTYKQILGSELFEDGESITKASRMSQLAGVAVGGVLLGGVGAIIGGLSGRRVEERRVKSIKLRLVVDDSTNPMHEVCFLAEDVARSETIYKRADEAAREWQARMEVLIKRADNQAVI